MMVQLQLININLLTGLFYEMKNELSICIFSGLVILKQLL
jgi:hypothetical protein